MTRTIPSVHKVTIKDYVVEEVIAEGGFGRVFKAIQRSTHQSVAIKTLKFNHNLGAHKRRKHISRFERETQLCAEMNHPNIVKLLDKGYTDQGDLYAVFEYVEGETLKDLIIKNNGLSPVETVHLMGQVLDALVSAHKKGIVHRDLKPQNIMVTHSGVAPIVKILDFGIGAITNEVQREDYVNVTLTKETIGTPAYSAPEQLRGEPPTVKSDIYAWGLVLLECLTGEQAIKGRTLAEVFQQQLSPGNIVIPPAIAGHELAELLRKVLDKVPDTRIGDTSKLYHDFVQINIQNLVGDLRKKRPIHYGENDTEENNLAWIPTASEKRQISVLVVKLSTKVLNNCAFDFETTETIQKDQLNICADIAARYGGFIAGRIGDHLLVYFGYPVMSDDSARRAGRTALEIVSHVKRRNKLLQNRQGFQLEVRSALHAGEILIEQQAVPEGQVSNIGFDLVYRAAPNTILVSVAAKRLLERFMEFSTEWTCNVSYFDQPFSVAVLLGEQRSEALSFLKSSGMNMNIVGRMKEQHEVLKIWNTVKLKRGKGVLVSGQAGIGKSRLLHEIKSTIAAQQYDIKNCRCLSEYQNNALYPLLRLFKKTWGITEYSKSEEVIQKLEQLLMHTSCELRQTIPVLCSWFAIQPTTEYSTLLLDPEQQKSVLFKAMFQLLVQMSNDLPMLIVIEDLHWADPTSIAFINYFLQQIEASKIMVLMSSRPEFKPEWERNSYKEIPLKAFNYEDTQRLTKYLLYNKESDQAVVDFIIQRSDGVPLYIVELIYMMLEKQYIREENGQYQLNKETNLTHIPITLKDLLCERLNNLGFAKETAQLAASIGRVFNYELLVNASLKDEALVQADLELLMNAELVYRQRRIDEESYIFRHALIRDAAYDSLVSQRKKEFHERIAETLEADLTFLIEENPFELANHLAEAGKFAKALEFGMNAIDKQVSNSSNREALRLYDLLIEWVASISEENLKKKMELALNNSIVAAVALSEGWGSTTLFKLAQRNNVLIEELKGSEAECTEELKEFDLKSEWTLFSYLHAQAKRTEARAVGERVLIKSQHAHNHGLEMTVSSILGQACFLDGDINRSETLLKNVIAKFSPEEDRDLYREYGTDSYIFANGMLGFINGYYGCLKTSLNHFGEGINYAKTTNNDAQIITSYVFVLCLLSTIDQKSLAEKYVIEVQHLYEGKLEDNWVTSLLYILIDWFNGTTALAEKKRNEIIAAGQDYVLSFYEPSMAKTYIINGQFDEAIQLMENSIARQIKNKEYSALPICYQQLAKALYLKKNNITNQVEKYINLAIDHSEKMGYDLLNAMVLFDYSEMLLAKNKQEQAYQLIDSIKKVTHKREEISKLTFWKECKLLESKKSV